MYSFIVNPSNKKIYDDKTRKSINKLTNHFQQTGGKYVSKGTYKCVHSPPISCADKSDKYNSDEYISALTTYPQAVSANKNENIKKQIDPEDQFTVKLIKTCKLGKLNPIKESAGEFRDCTSITNGNFLSNYKYPFEYYDYDSEEDLRLLISRNGGLDLSELIKELTKMDIKKVLIILPKLFKNFKNIFYGLSRFKEEEFIHCDIKPNNILYNIKTNRFNIIDLGLMTSFTKALTDEYFIQYTINVVNNTYYYRYWPLDAGVAALFLKRNKNKTDINHSPPISQGPNAYDNVRNPKNIRKLYYDNINNTETFIKASKEKLDTYSLGVTIKEFLYSDDINLLINKISKTYPKNANVKKIKIIHQRLLKLVDKMLNIDPFKRISIDSAHKEYLSIIEFL